APALVALGADDVKAAGVERLLLLLVDVGLDLSAGVGNRFLIGFRARSRLLGDPVAHAIIDVAAELDVGASTGHVGCGGDRTRDAGLGDDVGLLLVVAGVQDLMGDGIAIRLLVGGDR